MATAPANQSAAGPTARPTAAVHVASGRRAWARRVAKPTADTWASKASSARNRLTWSVDMVLSRIRTTKLVVAMRSYAAQLQPERAGVLRGRDGRLRPRLPGYGVDRAHRPQWHPASRRRSDRRGEAVLRWPGRRPAVGLRPPRHGRRRHHRDGGRQRRGPAGG